MLIQDKDGLYCPAGGFHIDPWNPVTRAVITHAHGDHARAGSASYLCAEPGKLALALRGGRQIQTLNYGEKIKIDEVYLSLHPAGHILGSAQIRMEMGGEIWVVSGDYKREDDPTCDPFEVVPCNTFITESTFALPIYRWQHSSIVMNQILDWWSSNRNAGRPSSLAGAAAIDILIG